MKKLIILALLSFNLFAWQTFTTDAGGIGITQSGVTGQKNAKIEILNKMTTTKYYLLHRQINCFS